MLPRISDIKGIHPGLLLGRELQKRGLTRSAFAATVGEHPQTIGAVINGRRSMNTPLALKIEQALGIEEGYFMTLQVHHDIRELKRQSRDQPHPDLAKLRPVLFWDTSMDKLDWQRQKRAIIRRVFERGNAAERAELRKFYGREVVKSVLAQRQHAKA